MRSSAPRQLQERDRVAEGYDLLVVGGGINRAGMARHAAGSLADLGRWPNGCGDQ